MLGLKGCLTVLHFSMAVLRKGAAELSLLWS